MYDSTAPGIHPAAAATLATLAVAALHPYIKTVRFPLAESRLLLLYDGLHEGCVGDQGESIIAVAAPARTSRNSAHCRSAARSAKFNTGAGAAAVGGTAGGRRRGLLLQHRLPLVSARRRPRRRGRDSPALAAAPTPAGLDEGRTVIASHPCGMIELCHPALASRSVLYGKLYGCQPTASRDGGRLGGTCAISRAGSSAGPTPAARRAPFHCT